MRKWAFGVALLLLGEKEMHFKRFINQLLPIIYLLLWVPISNSISITQLHQFCQSEDSNNLMCYVRSFADIPKLLPKNTEISQITDLIVRQTLLDRDVHSASDLFSRFTSLKKFHYTGPGCPFATLPNVSTLSQLSTIALYDTNVSANGTARGAQKQTFLPNLIHLEVIGICCDIFQGNILAPRLENLVFHCPKVTSDITGSSEASSRLHFTVPKLKILDYYENGLGFPVSSVANLPELNTLHVHTKRKDSDSLKDVVIVKAPLNLSSLTQLTYASNEFGVYASHYFQCVNLGDTNLFQVTLTSTSSGSLTCPAVWRCLSCHPNSSNDNQTVNIYVKSSSYTKLSSLLPKVVLNTTDLNLYHSPILELDKEAMKRFSHLKRLHVGNLPASENKNDEDGRNGVVNLLGNPFKLLPRPQEFRFLRIFLIECNCLAYDSFSWLRAQNAQFDGEIQCLEFSPKIEPEERFDLGRWITITEFIKRLEQHCQVSAPSTSVNLPTANRFLKPSMSEIPAFGGNKNFSLFVNMLLLYLVLSQI